MSAERVVIIVQARMSSTRMPGKVLAPLAGAPAIVRLIERLGAVKSADERVVATSDDASDDAVAAACAKHGIRCERGSLADVLARYHKAARAAAADVVVRVTGDCPLIDPTVVDACIALYRSERAHVAYASNVDERTYPDGLDVEVFSFDALDQAQQRAAPGFEREHVTPWVRRHLRKISLVQRVDLAHLRWTLDHREDYENIAAIYDALNNSQKLFETDDIYRLLVERPELIRLGHRQPLDDAERVRQVALIKSHLSDT